MQTSTLRPGLLVSLKTSVRGNVSYRKDDIERDHAIDETARRAKWETTRIVANAEEHEAATTARGKARYTIARICADTAFGLLCPESRRDDLEAAIAESRGIIDAFNDKATITRLSLYVIVGRVAQDDAEAARAIRAEMTDLLGAMESGVKALSPDKIREAAGRARRLGAMLSDTGKARVTEAVEAARKAATAIVKAAQAGEVAAEEVNKAALERLSTARTAFLDMDEAGDIAEPVASSRALDFEPEAEAVAVAAAPVAYDFL